jgi:hypothetical protein
VGGCMQNIRQALYTPFTAADWPYAPRAPQPNVESSTSPFFAILAAFVSLSSGEAAPTSICPTNRQHVPSPSTLR